ncbi:MAG TPA: nucleotide exchange factor GrpE [Anoxybacillus sp.]|nr:nucleotide exchange factor GrpE [Anoxybacillus sp.]
MKNVELEKEETSEKSYSKLQWFLFVVLIPLLFGITLTLVIVTVAGVNVFDAVKKYGEKIPGISQLIQDEQKPSEQILQDRLIEQKATVEEKTLQIKQLEQELENKQKEIDSLKKEIERLNAEIETKEQSTETEKEQEQKQAIKDIVKMYESMSAKNAAQIIPELSDNDAVTILSSINSEKAADILEKMDPANAAKYTSLLAKKTEANSTQ